MVTTYDLFDKKHKRDLRNFKFRIGAYGILRKGNKILVQRHPLLKQFGLPGGGVDIGEKIIEGLYREFKEETGLTVKIGHLLGVEEDMFTWKGEDSQSVLLYYEVKKTGGKLLKNGNQSDTGEVKYVDLSSLTSRNVQRVYWKMIKGYKRLKEK